MTGILASLFIITVLIIYGIYNGTIQRNKMQEGQDILLQNDSISMKMSEHFSKKQDSAIASAEELRDLIQKK